MSEAMKNVIELEESRCICISAKWIFLIDCLHVIKKNPPNDKQQRHWGVEIQVDVWYKAKHICSGSTWHTGVTSTWNLGYSGLDLQVRWNYMYKKKQKKTAIHVSSNKWNIITMQGIVLFKKNFLLPFTKIK